MKITFALCALAMLVLTGCGADLLGLEESDADERSAREGGYVVQFRKSGYHVIHLITCKTKKEIVDMHKRGWGYDQSPGGVYRRITKADAIFYMDSPGGKPATCDKCRPRL